MKNKQTQTRIKSDQLLLSPSGEETEYSGLITKNSVIQEYPDISGAVIPLSADMRLPVYRRLVFLIPNVNVDETRLGKEIRSHLQTFHVHICLITLIKDHDAEPIARRRLASLSALIREPGIKVDTQVIWGKSWEKTTKNIIDNEDVIICPEELNLSQGVGKKKRLCDWLNANTKSTVYCFSGVFPAVVRNEKRWIHKMLYWGVLIVIFIGFFSLEANLELLPNNWLQKSMESVALLVEASLIYMWTVVMR